MPKGKFHEDTNDLELTYKRVCEFEKPHYEKIEIEDDGSVILTIDKELYQQLENNEKANDDLFEPVKYSSYNSLYNNRYRNNFKRNLTAVKYSSLEKEIGKDNLSVIIQKDQELNKIYNELNKEKDLDNDGVPDRIDIDDSRNSVQTVKDLSEVKNSTTRSTQRYNEKKDNQEKERRRNNELEL